MNKDEAVQKLATAGRLSIAHAEDLYDSFFPKPVVPQFVADWYEENKDEFYLNLHSLAWDLVQNLQRYWLPENQSNNDFKSWYYNTKNAFQILINMHQFGYEVEKEIRYTVRVKGIDGYGKYLNLDTSTQKWLFASKTEFERFRAHHTRKELEEANFGWVFDCEGVEVKEVDE